MEEMCTAVRDASVVVTVVGVDELCISQLLELGVDFSVTVLVYGTVTTSASVLVLLLPARGVW